MYPIFDTVLPILPRWAVSVVRMDSSGIYDYFFDFPIIGLCLNLKKLKNR